MSVKECCGSSGPRHKKGCAAVAVQQEATQDAPEVQNVPESSLEAPKAKPVSEVELLKAQVAELARKDAEKDKVIEMLREVADKGRVFSWEAKQAKSGKPQKVKLTVIDGNVVVGWRTIKDELIKDPRTGRTSGEVQQYEFLLLSKDGSTSSKVVDGYEAFSNYRYDQRIECDVLSKSEGYDGNIEFELGLPDGRKLKLNSRFIN